MEKAQTTEGNQLRKCKTKWPESFANHSLDKSTKKTKPILMEI